MYEYLRSGVSSFHFERLHLGRIGLIGLIGLINEIST